MITSIDDGDVAGSTDWRNSVAVPTVFLAGSTRRSGWAKTAPHAGMERTSSSTLAPMAATTRWAITTRAIPAHIPSPLGSGRGWKMRNELSRGPMVASRTGSTTRAPSMASSVVATPAIPSERRKNCGKRSSDASTMETVIPEKNTVRPAVMTVRTTASSTSAPSASSSRIRLTISRA